jgi:hypothetical protein
MNGGIMEWVAFFTFSISLLGMFAYVIWLISVTERNEGELHGSYGNLDEYMHPPPGS